MHVEYVFANGRRAVVSVPTERWQAGGHTPVGAAVARVLHELELQAERIADSLPG